MSGARLSVQPMPWTDERQKTDFDRYHCKVGERQHHISIYHQPLFHSGAMSACTSVLSHRSVQSSLNPAQSVLHFGWSAITGWSRGQPLSTVDPARGGAAARSARLGSVRHVAELVACGSDCEVNPLRRPAPPRPAPPAALPHAPGQWRDLVG